MISIQIIKASGVHIRLIRSVLLNPFKKNIWNKSLIFLLNVYLMFNLFKTKRVSLWFQIWINKKSRNGTYLFIECTETIPCLNRTFCKNLCDTLSNLVITKWIQTFLITIDPERNSVTVSILTRKLGYLVYYLRSTCNIEWREN